MRVIIVEDEIPAQRMLQDMVHELKPDWQIVGIFDGVKATVKWLNNNEHPDLIFLDIQLSDGLGFTILERVKTNSFVIFTTAYDQYAIQAFKANTIDYLLKPIKKEELKTATEKLEFYKKDSKPNTISDVNFTEIINSLKNSKPQYRSRFLVNKGDSFIKLETNNVAFFYSLSKITYAVDFKNKTYQIDGSLEKLQEELDPEKFFRANRQTIVNINSVKKIELYFQGKLVVKTLPESSEKIIVSRERARFFKEWINK